MVNEFLNPLPNNITVNNGSVEFDNSNYILFNFEKTGVFLLDLSSPSYISYRIPTEWLDFLVSTICSPIEITDDNKQLINFLLQKKVLRKV